MVINRVHVGSLARLAACLYAGIGLIVGVCIFLVSLLGMGLPTDDPGMPTWIAPVFGIGAVVILPLFYGALGAIGLSIVGALYNLAAGMVGGVQFETDRAA
jgi:hypothetical protein